MKRTVWYNVRIGESIFDVVMRAVDLANQVNTRVKVKFNGTFFSVEPGKDNSDSYSAILKRWEAQGCELTENLVNFE